jgi:hypothetical protein
VRKGDRMGYQYQRNSEERLRWGWTLPLLVLLAPLTAYPQAPYRTVVVFGDTQTLVSAGLDAEYADFTAMIDWVVANKERENIDFVLHVGDIINLGTALMPLPSACDGAPDRTSQECRANGCFPPLSGCFLTAWNDCIACSGARDAVTNEWLRFDAQWSRLEPDPAADWSGVPYAIVRGNHDNVGREPPTDLETRGYNQYFSEARFEALERAFAGSNRYYEHVETYPGEDRDGHVWRFRIGSELVTVVGPSVWPTATQRLWVQDVLTRFRAHPAILLAHDMIERSQLWVDVVNPMATVAPQLFMTVQGHIRDDMKSIIDVTGYRVLRTVNDWSRTPSPQGSYLTLARFHFDPAGVDRVEALTYSPVLDEALILSDNYVELQPFGIDQDPDHDCIINPNDTNPFVPDRACGPPLAPILLPD